jgi:hypothetical protein
MFRALPDIVSPGRFRFNRISCVIWRFFPNRINEIKEFAITGGIAHLELTFEAERPPPPHNVPQELGRILTLDDMTAHNTFEKPERIKPAEFMDAKIEG